MRYIFEQTKYLPVLVLLFFPVTFVPQAFAGVIPSIDTDVTIDSITANPSTIEIFCTDPILSGGASITGNVLEIDDSILFDSIDVTTSGLVCDTFTPNIIDTASLTDLTTYNVRLTVSTDIPADSVATDSFVQPDAAIIVLDDISPGLYTIQFRDIGVIDNIGPIIGLTSKPATLTVTDHNANIDLSSAEKITVKINDIDTVLDETGVNTGIFSGPVTPGAVSYDPGTLGVARATIVIGFDVDTKDPDVGLALVAFAPDEMHEDSDANNVFDLSETVYLDADGNGIVSEDDTRLANAGSQGFIDDDVVIASDPDVGLALVAFAPDEMHEDSDANNVFDLSETVYLDADGNGIVSEDDTRLANAGSQGFIDGDVVFVGTGDIIVEDVILTDDEICCGSFTPVTHPVRIAFADGGMVDGTDIVVTMSYADADLATGDDPLLLQMWYQEPGFGYDRVTTSDDPASHDTVAKTVVSDPTFDSGFGPVFCCPTKEGNYVLGFNTGSGGGGGGGIAKSGFVVNALAGLGGYSSSGNGDNPPSFGQSSFAIISGGAEGFGGIINDNDANTLEETKTFKVGEKAVLRFDFTEGGGIGKIEHIKLFTNVRDGQKRQDSDASISYDPLKSPQVTVHDPNGIFSEANFELLQQDVTKFVLKYDLTFAKPMAKSDLILESWNIKKWSTINKIPNAIEVVSSGIVQETQSTPVDTFLEDVTDDQVIPVWVKSNAKWWSDDKIDNDNFISGLEYLVNEGIIKVSLPESTGNSISEVQPWIKSTAGWWADGMISEDEFITAIEWMITNNIIQVAA